MSSLSFPTSGAEITRDLESTHNLVRMTPAGRETLSYSLVLPKGWVTEHLGEQTDTPGLLVQIGLFAEYAGPNATIVQVQYTRVPFEIGVRDWLEFMAAQFGTELVYCQDLNFAGGPGVDAGGLYGPAENQQVMRMMAHADGGRIFLVSGMTPRFRYDSEVNNLAIATASFKLLRPTGSGQMEQWLASSGGDPAFHVAYPSSWESRPVSKKIPGKSGVDIVLAEENDLAGYLRVKAIDPAIAAEPSIQEALKIASEELEETQVLPTSNWTEDHDPGIARVEGPLFAFIASGHLNGRNIELRFAQLKRGRLVFDFTLISMEKSADAVLWMRTKRAYEIALGTAEQA